MTDEMEILTADEQGDDGEEPAVNEPAKLLRIALMLRGMQEEVRRAEVDEAGRERIRQVQEKAMGALRGVLSNDLQSELEDLTLPLSDGVPSESEILISQAQLLGWLEGLFQGIQAAISNQQFAARAQLEQMRKRGLPMGGPDEGGRPGPGQYL
jgi:hypothetical protein